MNAFFKPTEAVTQPGDLNAIPWTDVEGKREFSLQLGLAIGDEDLSFQDTVWMDPVADRLCATPMNFLDSGEFVSTGRNNRP